MNFFKKVFSCLMCFSIIASFQSGLCNVEAAGFKHKIPIAMATDENYVYPTVIAMTSMLENKDKNTHLDFNIMMSGEVNEEDIDRMKSFEKHYKDCSVRLINMNDDFKDAYTSSDRLTYPTYYRLKLPSIMPKCDKILYLDGDIIVRKDLWQMYNSSVEEHYVAGIKDFGHLDSGKEYAHRMGINDLDQYVNAGVLIMNLKKMRQDGIEKNFMIIFRG